MTINWVVDKLVKSLGFEPGACRFDPCLPSKIKGAIKTHTLSCEGFAKVL